jgi:hypothetical protein
MPTANELDYNSGFQAIVKSRFRGSCSMSLVFGKPQ